MHPTDARTYIVRPALKHLDPEIPYTLAAEELVMGTMWHESGGFQRVRQVIADGKRGRARGYSQTEPATLKWMRSVLRRPMYRTLAAKISSLKPGALKLPGERAEADVLQRSPTLAVAYCRFRYWLVSAPLPPNDPAQLAEYWSRFYNTVQSPWKWSSDYQRMLKKEAKL